MPAIRAHRRCTNFAAFTLIELLLTIAVIGIIAAVLIPELSSDLPDRLSAASQVVAADIDYARALAVANNSTYRITFTPTQNKYVLQYSGTNGSLGTLPPSPFKLASDAATQQTTDLGQLPLPLPAVNLAAAVTMQPGAISAPNELQPCA